MKILFIAQEPELAPDKIVTGNAIRTQQLSQSLAKAGHDIVHTWYDEEKQGMAGSFSDRDELRGLLTSSQAEACLVSYWELLDMVPFELEIPVILDFLAPRPLEQLFERPGQVQHDLHRLKVNLSKIDLMLVANEGQAQLATIPLLGSGFDLRQERGIEIVPLAAEMTGTPRSDPGEGGLTVVSGGVNWPWRDARAYLEPLKELTTIGSLPFRLEHFGGKYSLNEESGEASEHPETRAMLPYSEFSEFLLNHAHIGIELSEENIERKYSQSFRSLDFLRHGLPVICNRFLPIAKQIEQFDAGWLIDEPEELLPLLEQIATQSGAWKKKSENAERLVREHFEPGLATAPLVRWLEKPHKASRLPHEPPAIAQLGNPPPIVRLKKVIGLINESLRRKLFLLQKRWFGGRKANGIVFVTRGDLFPADHGAAVKIIETARGLSKHGNPVALVTDDRRYWWKLENGEIVRHKIPIWLRLVTWPSLLVKINHFTKDIPESNAFLYLPMTDGSFFWRTIYAGRKVGASVIQAEFPAYVRPSIPASHVLDARVVMVEHNVEYERIRAQVPELTDEQYQRYRAIEIDLANQSDAVICVSDNDRQQLAQDGVALGRLHTIPHGVDLEQFELPAQADARERFGIPGDAPLFVYHGTFAYPPNLQALDVFANELLPRLEQLGLSCHVLAVGRQPPDASPHPRIHLTGSVDSVAPWLKAADIAVVPLLEGGGTRMKIVDCFAAQLPLISTAKGIEGIPVENGRQALIIDDWDEMAAAIKNLIENPAEAKRLADNGYQLASKLDWYEIAGRYLEIYKRL